MLATGVQGTAVYDNAFSKESVPMQAATRFVALDATCTITFRCQAGCSPQQQAGV
jgi:hypothetical protein